MKKASRNLPKTTSNSKQQRIKALEKAKTASKESASARSKLSLARKLFIASAILAVVSAIMISVALTKFNGSSSEPTSTPSTSSSSSDDEKIRKYSRSVTGNSIEQDKKDATNAAAKLLNASKTADGQDAKKRVQQLDEGDMSTVTQQMKDGVHLSDQLADETNEKFTYESLVALKGEVFKNNEVKMAKEDAYKSSYADPESGAVDVPIAVFTGNNIALSMHMVYIDGQWKLAPYSLIEGITSNAQQMQATEGMKNAPTK